MKNIEKLKKIILESNYGKFNIMVKFKEDKTISYCTYYGSDICGGNWKGWFIADSNESKADVCKKIIEQIEKEDVIKIMESNWKTKILDAILPVEFPKEYPKCCRYCKYCRYTNMNLDSVICTKYDESLKDCNIEIEVGCMDFELDEEYI